MNMRPEDYFFIPFTIIVVIGAVWLYAKWTWVRILTFIYYSVNLAQVAILPLQHFVTSYWI